MAIFGAGDLFQKYLVLGFLLVEPGIDQKASRPRGKKGLINRVGEFGQIIVSSKNKQVIIIGKVKLGGLALCPADGGHG